MQTFKSVVIDLEIPTDFKDRMILAVTVKKSFEVNRENRRSSIQNQGRHHAETVFAKPSQDIFNEAVSLMDDFAVAKEAKEDETVESQTAKIHERIKFDVTKTFEATFKNASQRKLFSNEWLKTAMFNDVKIALIEVIRTDSGRILDETQLD